MPRVKIKRMKAGDPGVGFVITIDPESSEHTFDLSNSFTIKVDVTDPSSSPDSSPHTCNMTVNPPYDKELVIVLPFGCSHYTPGLTITVLVTLTQGTNQFLNQTFNIVAQGGEFEYILKRHFLSGLTSNPGSNPAPESIYQSTIFSGEYIISQNNQYICRMEFAGRLAIYDLHANDPGKAIWQTRLPVGNPGQGEYYAMLDNDYNLCISNGFPVTASDWCSWQMWEAWKASQPHETIPSYPPGYGNSHLVITDDGKLQLFSGLAPDPNEVNATPLVTITDMPSDFKVT